jgi:Spy/CpxP family protein refolding chaperone
MFIRLVFTCILSISLSTFAFAQEDSSKHQNLKTFYKMALPSPDFLLKFEADLSLSSKQVKELEKLSDNITKLKQKKRSTIKTARENLEKQLQIHDADEGKIQRAIRAVQDEKNELRTEMLFIHAKARAVLNEDQRKYWVNVGNKKMKKVKGKKDDEDDDEDDDSKGKSSKKSKKSADADEDEDE